MQFPNQPLSHFAAASIEELFKMFHSSDHGLSEQEAIKRVHEFGHNVLVQEKKDFWILKYLSNFTNPLVLILLFAAVASFVLGQAIDAIIIFIVVIFSTTLNFFQEYHASKAAQKLEDRVATHATVVRDGKEQEIKIRNITFGDVILLQAGDIIPADARIIEAKDFFVNQSSLTGESFPVEKVAIPQQHTHESLTELTNIVFSGSNVTTGSAKALVIQTGNKTEFGKIAAKLQEAPIESEFTNGIKKLSILIMKATVFFVLFIFLVNTGLKEGNFFDSFTFAVAIAVGLTPELLPMIMSVTMAKGSFNMAKKGVIVKRLASIPDFGEMDILCTDKTGTLTENKIELVTYTDVAGNHSEQVLLQAYLNSFYQTGIKNPMDEAVIQYKKEEIKDFKKVDEIPFDFERRKMSVIVQKGSSRTIITKGAPEEILKSCASYQQKDVVKKLDHATHEKILKQYHDLSNQGYRVLAIATKQIHDKKTVYEKSYESDLAFLGFIGFLDPAKKGIKEILTDLEAMGIEVKVITGDNELVTQKICNDVGLPIKGIILGTEIAHMTTEALRAAVKGKTIFARCSPEEKNRIITALRARKHVVGYLGDGINDAPSLKAANIGISVNNAVDVAKESADMILTHKSLQELKDGVLEGRKTFGNTMKYIMMGISANFGNMFSVLGAVLFLPFLPMLPIQILLNNLLYDLSQISIPTDNVDEEYIQQPKKWDMTFIRNFMLVFGPISSLFDFLTFYFLYAIFKLPAAAFQTGWFIESLATQVLVIYIIRTRRTPFLESIPSKYLIVTTLLAVGTAFLLPFIGIGSFFSFVQLPQIILITICFIVLGYLLTVELAKRIFYKSILGR